MFTNELNSTKKVSSKIECSILYIFIFYDSLQTVDKSIGAIYMALHKNDLGLAFHH